MMLQEYIPGPPTNHYFIDGFIDRGGVVRAIFARRRLRMSPPDFGNSTMQISVPVSDTGDASATLRTLLADIDYRGIFSAEFKRDPRDGAFNLIEVNARPWWYIEFAARCGVNVGEMAVRDALVEPVETISGYAVGRRCVFPYYDLDAVRAERSAGRLGLETILAVMQILDHTLSRLKYLSYPRTVMELGLVRICQLAEGVRRVVDLRIGLDELGQAFQPLSLNSFRVTSVRICEQIPSPEFGRHIWP
jgi:hypothetical protein